MKNRALTTILVLLVFSLCLTSALGQKIKNLAENRSEIALILSVKEFNQNVCNLTKLPLSIKITNIGRRTFAFDTRRVTRKLYIRAVKTTINTDGKSGSSLQTDSEITFPHFQMKPSYIILKPKESYEAQISLDLTSLELASADFLHIQTDYDNSNKEIYLNVPVFVGYKRSSEVTLNLSSCK